MVALTSNACTAPAEAPAGESPLRLPMSDVEPSVTWPARRNIFGIDVSVTTVAEAAETIVEAAKQRRGGSATFLPVHGIVTGAMDKNYRDQLNSLDLIGPDGQPVRWALNLLRDAGMTRRVYGPETTLAICRRAAAEGVGIYLYGSTQDVLVNLRSRLETLYPDLKIIGIESPPFRALTEDEKRQTAQRINASGAGIVFVGLGCPRQESFAAEMRPHMDAVLVCVGAAFDFHAGNKRMAPPWMQKRGLEWLFRLISEPRRLWRRYLVTNTIFLFLLGINLLKPNRG